ncbi:MAG: hypothetical protein ACK55I_48915, partial [bacterium]
AMPRHRTGLQIGERKPDEQEHRRREKAPSLHQDRESHHRNSNRIALRHWCATSTAHADAAPLVRRSIRAALLALHARLPTVSAAHRPPQLCRGARL